MARNTFLNPSSAGIENPLQAKGSISASSDFPTSADVQTGWVFLVLSDVTDNDATKTNTGQTFSSGDEIMWNGTDWTVIGNINHSLNDLNDVTITSPVDNEFLAYDSSSGNWINQTPTEAGLDSIYLKLDDSISLPEDYIKFVFATIKNAELTDLELDISNTKITFEFDGKIEVDGRKIDNGKIVINDDLTYDYRYKDEKYEDNTEFGDILIINGDRELTLEVTNETISIGDYDFDYVFGPDEEFTTAPIGMNEDDDYMLDKGDLLYKSEVNEDDRETSIKIGLISDEEVELVLKIQ